MILLPSLLFNISNVTHSIIVMIIFIMTFFFFMHTSVILVFMNNLTYSYLCLAFHSSKPLIASLHIFLNCTVAKLLPNSNLWYLPGQELCSLLPKWSNNKTYSANIPSSIFQRYTAELRSFGLILYIYLTIFVSFLYKFEKDDIVWSDHLLQQVKSYFHIA